MSMQWSCLGTLGDPRPLLPIHLPATRGDEGGVENTTVVFKMARSPPGSYETGYPRSTHVGTGTESSEIQGPTVCQGYPGRARTLNFSTPHDYLIVCIVIREVQEDATYGEEGGGKGYRKTGEAEDRAENDVQQVRVLRENCGSV